MAVQNVSKNTKIGRLNPYRHEHHYMKTTDWIKQCFEIQRDEQGRPIVIPDCPFIDENGNLQKQNKYKIKRKAELWMIELVLIADIEMVLRKKNRLKSNDFAFYGSLQTIRNIILNSVDPCLVPQLSRSITIKTLSTSLRRAEKSGFIKIEYNPDIKRETYSDTKNYRRITLNYDKLMELSEFNLERKRSQTWLKYHSSSREHRWIRKRPISYLKPLIDDLADSNKKEEFRRKLAKLKLKLKNHQDVFKAWIMSKQKFYETMELKNLTAVKSKKDESDEILALMYHKPDTSGFVMTRQQKAIFNGLVAQMG